MNRRGDTQPSSRMLPAQQRLDAAQLAGARVDARLVVQRQLVALDRVAQAAFELQPLLRAPVQVLGEEVRPCRGRCALASYIATSAWRISSSMSAPSSG